MTSTTYILIDKIDLNEGFSTGTITKACMLLTPSFIFMFPFDSIGQLGLYTTQTTYHNTTEFIAVLKEQLEKEPISSVEESIKKVLPEERVYQVNDLAKFTVQVGFWIFGGLQLKKKGGSLQAVNVQPKSTRQAIKEFYKL